MLNKPMTNGEVVRIINQLPPDAEYFVDMHVLYGTEAQTRDMDEPPLAYQNTIHLNGIKIDKETNKIYLQVIDHVECEDSIHGYEKGEAVLTKDFEVKVV